MPERGCATDQPQRCDWRFAHSRAQQTETTRTTAMKHTLPLIGLAGLLAASAVAADNAAPPYGQRVFVCAHSFMIFTARMLPPVAEAAGIKHVVAGQQMIGGSRVIQHWELPDDQNKAKETLRAGKVDVLTLSPHMLLPDDGIDHFTRLGLEKNPKLRVLVQASWPARDGQLTRDFKNEQRDATTVAELEAMRTRHGAWLKGLEAQVATLNKSVGREAVHIIPVSEAVFALRKLVAEGKAPGVAKQSELFRDPLGHTQPALAALVTYCHFAAIYQRSPAGLPVPEVIKDLPKAAELNRVLQDIAWDAVSKYPMSGVNSTSKTSTP
jgi:hypothetical protein